MDKAISPLDGRYGKRLAPLRNYFSEFALMRMRCLVELRYLKALNETGLFTPFSAGELARIRQEEAVFSDASFDRIKAIEAKINHDVKACELFLRECLMLANPNIIHFGLTSEDVNNLSYSLLLSAYVREQQIPLVESLISTLCRRAVEWKSIPFPARTHGQLASPTTAGKEIAVYISRLLRQLRRLRRLRFRGKLNGATGNYSAWHAAYPAFDWRGFSRTFVEDLGLESNPVTTQIEDHDSWVDYLLIIRQMNSMVLNLDRDLWLYMTLGYCTTTAVQGEVGSSTMPHKVNPINFENSEGNIEMANSILLGLVDKLVNSRLQRDLSDSTATRNLGVALGHGHLAIQETVKGLSKLEVNEKKCLQELEQNPELLAEPIQTVLRRENVDDPYELLKELTRGRRLTMEEIGQFVEGLVVEDSVKQQLHALSVQTYTGYAEEICQSVIDEAREELRKDGLS